MGDLLGDGGETLVVPVAACARLAHQFWLVDLGGDHGDVHQEEHAFQRRLFGLEGGSALESDHLPVAPLDPLDLGLCQLDADVQRLVGEDVRLEDEKIRVLVVGDEGEVVQTDADLVLLGGVLDEIFHL